MGNEKYVACHTHEQRVNISTRHPAGLTESVAVVVTSLNDTEFLGGEALSSVIAQPHPADEIIVVVDGSYKSPALVLASFHKPLWRAIRGLSSART